MLLFICGAGGAGRLLLSSFSEVSNGQSSVWKSGPVRSFGLERLRPGPRPVFQIWKTLKDRTEPL